MTKTLKSGIIYIKKRESEVENNRMMILIGQLLAAAAFILLAIVGVIILNYFFDYLVERVKQYITELRLVFKKNPAILKCNRYLCKYNKNGECYNMPVRITVLGNCKVALNDEVMGYDKNN